MTAYNRLPEGTRSPEFEGILAAWDETIAEARDALDPDIFAALYFDPLTAIALDWRAQTSLWRGLWQVAWTEDTKRALLTNQIEIFQRRYDAVYLLPRLFAWFGLNATVEAIAGFRLGADTTPATLGVPLASYVVKVPSTYTIGSLERSRVESIMDTFGLPIRFPIQFI